MLWGAQHSLKHALFLWLLSGCAADCQARWLPCRPQDAQEVQHLCNDGPGPEAALHWLLDSDKAAHPQCAGVKVALDQGSACPRRRKYLPFSMVLELAHRQACWLLLHGRVVVPVCRQ